MNDNNSDSVRSIDSDDDDRTVPSGDTCDLAIPGDWYNQAARNIEEWGLQNPETLLLAMQEELGELTQAHLEATHESGDKDRIAEELDDLGALLLQLDARIREYSLYSELRTDGGESQQTTEQCGMYDCPTREGPVVKTRTLSAARSTTPVEMLMCQSCIDDGWAMEVLD